MLYLSTRNKADSFTAYRVLRAEAADEGMFMPMQVPVQDDFAMASFERMSFGEAAATILNLFFGTQISGWDVDFAVGRQVLDLVEIGHKVSIAESWHNPAGTHAYLVQRLYALALGEKSVARVPNLWFCTVVDIAILFGIYGKFCRRDLYEFDVAVHNGDLLMLLAVRYAQRMGLPIRKIILGCSEEDGLWDFLAYGDYMTSKKDRALGLEGWLWLELGYEEVARFLASSKKKAIYRLDAAPLEQFRTGIFAAVVGDYRVKNVLDSFPHTNNYQMEVGTARSFAALQDYRAKTGENNNTLLFTRNVPVKEKR